MRASFNPRTPRRIVASGPAGGRPKVRGSAGSGPSIARYNSAASSTERAIGPGVSRVGLSGKIPYVLTRPIVVLRPLSPHQDAGNRTEPPVSVPIAQGAKPAATATPEPLLDPPGVCAVLGFQGFHGVPRYWLVPQPPIANSTVCVLPITISPAAIRRRASVAVQRDCRFLHTSEPPVVTLPSISIRSLSAIGIPCRGPIACPERIALSAASAANRASSA